MGNEESYWSEALRQFKAGDRARALEIFDKHIFHSPFKGITAATNLTKEDIQTIVTWSKARIVNGTPKEDPEGNLYAFFNYVVDRYCDTKETYELYGLIQKLTYCPRGTQRKSSAWPILSPDIQRKVIKQLLSFEKPDYLEFVKEDYRGGEVYGIILCLALYHEAGHEDREIEEIIISYAYKREWYDCVLMALEQFGRLREALALFDEVPHHLLFPGCEDPQKEAKKAREKLEFKLKQIHPAEITKAKSYSKEEIERMFALGEITKAEYERMTTRIQTDDKG